MRGNRGFTLIEILIVVVIVGVLSAIAIPKFGRAREQAAVSAMQSDLNQLRTAMEMYHDRNTTYAGTQVLDEIALSSGVRVEADIVGDANSWAVTLGHSAYPNVTCAYDSSVGQIDCVTP